LNAILPGLIRTNETAYPTAIQSTAPPAYVAHLVAAKLNWADRALIATLLSVILDASGAKGCGCWPPERILCWHRDIVRRHRAARSMRGRTGRPTTRRNRYRRIHGELAALGLKVAAPRSELGIPAVRRLAITY
jgi:hypothetical protein